MIILGQVNFSDLEQREFVSKRDLAKEIKQVVENSKNWNSGYNAMDRINKRIRKKIGKQNSSFLKKLTQTAENTPERDLLIKKDNRRSSGQKGLIRKVSGGYKKIDQKFTKPAPESWRYL